MWKNVKNWEDYYEINELGKIRNKLTNEVLVGDTNSTGYHRVSLQNKNHTPVQKRYFVHRLVAEHYIPNPDNLPEVNHKDSNINNNISSNLEWSNKKDNERHSRKYGNKEFKPFKVIYTNGNEKVYEFKQDLADELQVDRCTVKCWLHNTNKGYRNHGIESIGYI